MSLANDIWPGDVRPSDIQVDDVQSDNIQSDDIQSEDVQSEDVQSVATAAPVHQEFSAALLALGLSLSAFTIVLAGLGWARHMALRPASESIDRNRQPSQQVPAQANRSPDSVIFSPSASPKPLSAAKLSTAVEATQAQPEGNETLAAGFKQPTQALAAVAPDPVPAPSVASNTNPPNTNSPNTNPSDTNPSDTHQGASAQRAESVPVQAASGQSASGQSASGQSASGQAAGETPQGENGKAEAMLTAEAMLIPEVTSPSANSAAFSSKLASILSPPLPIAATRTDVLAMPSPSSAVAVGAPTETSMPSGATATSSADDTESAIAPPEIFSPEAVELPVPTVPMIPTADPAETVQIPESPESPESPELPEPSVSVSVSVPLADRPLSITGSTVFADEELQGVVDEARERLSLSEKEPLSTADLVQLSDAITQYYIDRAYISSGAYVPVQEDADAPPEIRILEGRLSEVDVTVESAGLFSLRPSYIANRLRTVTQGPLNLSQLVERVQLLEQDPLIDQITTDIVPGLTPGASTLNVSVIPDDGFDVQLSTNTYNSPSIGRFGQQVGVSQANLLGVGDRLSVGLSSSEGSDRWRLGYSLPLNTGLNGHSGLLSFDYTDASNRIVEEPFDELDIVSDAQTYELSFRQPLIRRPTEELALSLTGYHRSSEGAFLEGFTGAAQPFIVRGSDDEGITRVSALRLGQTWVRRSPQTAIALQSEFSLGVDALNATINESGPDGRFFHWRTGGQWTRRLGQDSLWLVRGGFQLADGPLVPSEQFGVGGQGSVRGYRPNAVLTDDGWLLSSEVRLPILRSPSVNGLLQIAPFVDFGGGSNRGGFESPSPSVLSSTGVGLIWQMGDNFDARVDWGVPLSGGQSIQDSGIQFQINYTPF